MSNFSEQDDDYTMPPPINDWDDESWDDDVLPPPPCLHEDLMSFVSDDASVRSESELQSSEPGGILHENLSRSSEVAVSECATTTPVAVDRQSRGKFLPKEIINDETVNPLSVPPFLVPGDENTPPISYGAATFPEVFQGPPTATIAAASDELLDNEVDSIPLAHASIVPEIAETAPRYKSDKSIPGVIQDPSDTNTRRSEFPDAHLDPSQEFFYPHSPMSPQPSAPLEPTDTDEAASTMAAILSALDPCERTAFLLEQNKILENIEREASNQKASTELALNMMLMDKDAELARRLQEEERQSFRSTESGNRTRIIESDATRRAMLNGKTILVECMSCQKRMYIPKGTKRMHCPICKKECSFENISKRNSRGLFGTKSKTKRR